MALPMRETLLYKKSNNEDRRERNIYPGIIMKRAAAQSRTVIMISVIANSEKLRERERERDIN